MTTLESMFVDLYGVARSPRLLRAPGRVNLIGEHTDYNGYPVLPMAIARGIRCLAAPRNDGTVRIANTDGRFGERVIALDALEHAFPQGDWANYVLAALRGLFVDAFIPREHALGFDAVFDSDLPVASGLSSSSALVVVSALAALAANGRSADPLLLATALARAERHAGAEGGGMDQAIALLARKGHALKIDFFPLRTRPVPIPDGCDFVVCNSLVPAAKTAAAREAYNHRVAECRLAALLLATALGIDPTPSGRPIRLAALSPAATGLSVNTLLDAGEDAFGTAPWSARDVSQRTGIPLPDLELRYRLPDADARFHLLQRFRHVLTEAARVQAAALALAGGAAEAMGSLMDASHASCRDDYDVSCPELEELVALAKRHGALGARLTGAGFGGCTVNLLPADMVDTFITAMARDFYAAREDVLAASGMTLNDALFPCVPSDGAGEIAVTDREAL
ncbi:MAG: galactokinase [Ignavibacteria bacterium]|nr:galactokinase [Ignavibacteria bacterium]